MRTRHILTIAGLLAAAAIPVLAHHSFAAEYDDKKPVTLVGSVVKTEWLNPHVWLYLDVKDDKGNMVRWQCEGGAPNSIIRQGWSRTTLKPGDQITIEGFRAKDSTNTCNSRSVKLPNGSKVFAGSADDGGPNAKGAPKE
jgi:hypothetical protein